MFARVARAMFNLEIEQRGIRRRELHGYQPTPDVVAR
jgi:hypothetical protein